MIQILKKQEGEIALSRTEKKVDGRRLHLVQSLFLPWSARRPGDRPSSTEGLPTQYLIPGPSGTSSAGTLVASLSPQVSKKAGCHHLCETTTFKSGKSYLVIFLASLLYRNSTKLAWSFWAKRSGVWENWFGLAERISKPKTMPWRSGTRAAS